MKMEGFAERLGVGLVGLLLGCVLVGVLVISLHFWTIWFLAIPPVCMILAMIFGDPVIETLKWGYDWV